jgi:hypothetical protein
MSIQDCIELYGEALSESEKAWLEGLAQSPDLLDQVNTRIETLGGERQTIIEAIGEHQPEAAKELAPDVEVPTARQSVQEGLEASGRYTEPQIEAYMELWDSIGRSWAEYHGRDPQDWYDTWMVDVRAERFEDFIERMDREGVLYQPYEPSDLGRTMVDEAVAEFGTTEDIMEAGYILPDGRLLDLTGRRESVGYDEAGVPKPGEPDYLGGTRAVDHREVGRLPVFADRPAPEEDVSASADMIEFVNETGGIRVHASRGRFDERYPNNIGPGGEVYLNFFGTPSRDAVMKAARYIRRDWEAVIDITDPETGYNIESTTARSKQQLFELMEKHYPEWRRAEFQAGLEERPFYSKLQRTVEQQLPNAGAPQQFRKTLESWQKKGQYTREELEWSGILEWLDEQEARGDGRPAQ